MPRRKTRKARLGLSNELDQKTRAVAELEKNFTENNAKLARDVQERVERYRAFCGALELADLVEHALGNAMLPSSRAACASHR